MRALLLLVAACASTPDGAPPCATVAGHLFQLSRDALARTPVDDATRRALADRLPALRDAAVQTCRDTEWPASVRTCMTGAADHPAFVACAAALTEAQRRAIDRAARPDIEPN